MAVEEIRRAESTMRPSMPLWKGWKKRFARCHGRRHDSQAQGSHRPSTLSQIFASRRHLAPVVERLRTTLVVSVTSQNPGQLVDLQGKFHRASRLSKEGRKGLLCDEERANPSRVHFTTCGIFS